MGANRRVCAAVALLGAWASVTAAQDRDFLYWSFDPGADPITGAINELELRGPRVFLASTFLDQLRTGQWPIIIIRQKDALDPALEAEVIDLLVDQLHSGASLLVNIAELDEMPAMQRFLGLEGAVDIVPPLQFANTVVYDRRFHPAAAGGPLPTTGFPTGPDFGDVLIPGPNARPIFEFRDDRTVASVLSRAGRVIVNGWEWSSWGLGVDVATEQIRWLISCPADLDGNGALDVFDFLEFQTLFAAGDPAADWFDYDGELTVFDFLAFFDAFEVGCP